MTFHWPCYCSSQLNMTFHWPCYCSSQLNMTIHCPCYCSSQLNMTFHWPCYCNVHIFVVIHFCDSVWSFWLEANLCRYLIVYVYHHWILVPIIKRVWIDWFTWPHFLWLSQSEPRFTLLWCLCYLQWFKVSSGCSCWWYQWNCWTSLLKQF